MQIILDNKVYNTENSECFGAIYTWLTEYSVINHEKLVQTLFFYKTPTNEYFIHNVPGPFAHKDTPKENIIVIDSKDVNQYFCKWCQEKYYPVTHEIFNFKIFQNLQKRA